MRTRSRKEVLVVTEVTTEVQEQTAAQECCESECGPDTCGGLTSKQDVRIEDKPAAAQECCEPDCGPDTCG